MMDRSICPIRLLKLFGRDVTKRRMEALAIVEAFQIGKDDGSGLGAGFELITIHAFGFEFTPDTLHWRVIEAVVGTRQTNLNAKAGKNGLILSTAILSTSVRMVQQPGLRLASQQRHA